MKKVWSTSDAQPTVLYAHRNNTDDFTYPIIANSTGAIQVAANIVDDLGGTQGIKFIDGKPRVSAMPYTYDISEGNISGHRPWSKIGFCQSVATTELDIAPWLTSSYVFPTTTSTMTIVSTNAGDKVDGAGARTVTVYYLNEQYEEKSKTVTLTGLTEATIAIDMFRVNNARVVTTGTSNSTIGNLTIASGGITYGYISAGKTRMRQCIWTVPSCCTLYITQIAFSGSNQNPSKPGGIRFTTRANYDNLSGLVLQRGLFQPYNEVVLYNSAYYRDLNPPTKLPATTDLKVSAVSLVADPGDITCSLRGWLETV